MFRGYITLIVFVVLLLWGPIDYSWPYWLGIRIGYLILIPIVVSLLLKLIWKVIQPSQKVESILERILFSFVFIAFIILAGLVATSKTHIENTKVVRTHDGYEAVGDDIVVPGPDYGNALLLVFIAILIFWYGLLKKGSKNSEKSDDG